MSLISMATGLLSSTARNCASLTLSAACNWRRSLTSRTEAHTHAPRPSRLGRRDRPISTENRLPSLRTPCRSSKPAPICRVSPWAMKPLRSSTWRPRLATGTRRSIASPTNSPAL
ncbi:hypothetical protein D3C78_1245970 [compost metagenome]